MKKKLLKATRNIMICAMCTALFVPNVMAGSTNITLYEGQYKACSSQLGNITGKYNIEDKTFQNSKYAVETYLYYGLTSDHCGAIKTHWTVAPGKSKNVNYSIAQNKGTVARITLYSNVKSNQTKKCSATATLSNAK